jgi:predicted ATPase
MSNETPNTAGAIQSLELTNFTAFEQAKLEFTPGLNVFIGANSTGKTHAMKAMYAMTWMIRSLERNGPPSEWQSKIREVFRAPGSEISRTGVAEEFQLHERLNRFTITATGHSFGMETDANIGEEELAQLARRRPVLFLPSREVLSMFEGFSATYRKRELSFDETYVDVCDALGLPLLRNGAAAEAEALAKPVLELLGGRAVLDDGRFYVEIEGRKLRAHLVSDGMRKVAMLAQLIANGSLDKDTILFWDEPESGLNPAWTVKIAELLVDLAAKGVQIFVSTHDYLLTHRLSLISEYKKVPAAQIRFHSFAKTAEHGVKVTHGEVMADFPENPLIDEFSKEYDFERDLFTGN